jgi:hypothetical protein
MVDTELLESLPLVCRKCGRPLSEENDDAGFKEDLKHAMVCDPEAVESYREMLRVTFALHLFQAIDNTVKELKRRGISWAFQRFVEGGKCKFCPHNYGSAAEALLYINIGHHMILDHAEELLPLVREAYAGRAAGQRTHSPECQFRHGGGSKVTIN